MLCELWPIMSRPTCSGTPISAARVDHVCRRSWNVRFSIPASLHADVKPCLTSIIFRPVRMLSNTYSAAASSAQSRSITRRTLPLIGIVRGLPFLLFSMSSQPGRGRVLWVEEYVFTEPEYFGVPEYVNLVIPNLPTERILKTRPPSL